MLDTLPASVNPAIGTTRLGLDKAHLVGNSYGGACALRLALDTPDRVERMVLMGPGGIGTTRALPTPGLNSLLNYYSGDGPSRPKLEKFIRNFLVFNAADVPDSVIDARYEASIDPEVVAAPPLRRPSGPNALRTMWKMDFTRDDRLSRLPVPTLVLWGAADKVNRPSGGRMLADRMPNCDLYEVANTGHWVQVERAELFNRVCADFLAGRR
uniref:Alpha/beta fold hydrolase n=1 Tax=Streptomyces sp. NBC_00093 TaxID=2975649 RepID=A0AAU1ZPC7_9ACTN